MYHFNFLNSVRTYLDTIKMTLHSQMNCVCSLFQIYLTPPSTMSATFNTLCLISSLEILELITTILPLGLPLHTTQTVKNKWEKMEQKGKVIFDIPLMVQSHAESMNKILGALQDLPANQNNQFSPISHIMERQASQVADRS